MTKRIAVCPGSADQNIEALASIERICSLAALDHVGGFAALQAVITRAAVEPGRDADGTGDVDVVVAIHSKHSDPIRAGKGAD